MQNVMMFMEVFVLDAVVNDQTGTDMGGGGGIGDDDDDDDDDGDENPSTVDLVVSTTKAAARTKTTILKDIAIFNPWEPVLVLVWSMLYHNKNDRTGRRRFWGILSWIWKSKKNSKTRYFFDDVSEAGERKCFMRTKKIVLGYHTMLRTFTLVGIISGQEREKSQKKHLRERLWATTVVFNSPKTVRIFDSGKGDTGLYGEWLVHDIQY